MPVTLEEYRHAVEVFDALAHFSVLGGPELAEKIKPYVDDPLAINEARWMLIASASRFNGVHDRQYWISHTLGDAAVKAGAAIVSPIKTHGKILEQIHETGDEAFLPAFHYIGSSKQEVTEELCRYGCLFLEHLKLDVENMRLIFDLRESAIAAVRLPEDLNSLDRIVERQKEIDRLKQEEWKREHHSVKEERLKRAGFEKEAAKKIAAIGEEKTLKFDPILKRGEDEEAKDYVKRLGEEVGRLNEETEQKIASIRKEEAEAVQKVHSLSKNREIDGITFRESLAARTGALNVPEFYKLRKEMIVPSLEASLEIMAEYWGVDPAKRPGFRDSARQEVRTGKSQGKTYLEPISEESWKEAKALAFLQIEVPKDRKRQKLPAGSLLRPFFITEYGPGSQTVERVGDIFYLEAEFAKLAKRVAGQTSLLAEAVEEIGKITNRAGEIMHPAARYLYGRGNTGRTVLSVLQEDPQSLRYDYLLMRDIADNIAEQCGCLDKYRAYRKEHSIDQPPGRWQRDVGGPLQPGVVPKGR